MADRPESDAFEVCHMPEAKVGPLSNQLNPLDQTVDYSNEALRRKSYYRLDNMWPGEISKPSITKMVKAGFVHVGPDDYVECYSCGLKLHTWGKNEDPSAEHKEYLIKKHKLCKLYPDVTADDFDIPDPTQAGAGPA